MKNRVSLSERQSSPKNFFLTLSAADSSESSRELSFRNRVPNSQSLHVGLII